MIFINETRKDFEEMGSPVTDLIVKTWTLAFFEFSSVRRFSKSPYVPEEYMKFARLQ
jgi:hypothetical protein